MSLVIGSLPHVIVSMQMLFFDPIVDVLDSFAGRLFLEARYVPSPHSKHQLPLNPYSKHGRSLNNYLYC